MELSALTYCTEKSHVMKCYLIILKLFRSQRRLERLCLVSFAKISYENPWNFVQRAFNLSSYVVTRELLKRVNCSFQFRQLSTHYTEFYGDFMPFSSLFVDLVDVSHESCPFRSLAIVRPLFVVPHNRSLTFHEALSQISHKKVSLLEPIASWCSINFLYNFTLTFFREVISSANHCSKKVSTCLTLAYDHSSIITPNFYWPLSPPRNKFNNPI